MCTVMPSTRPTIRCRTKRNHFKRTFAGMPKPEPGLACYICATFSELRTPPETYGTRSEYERPLSDLLSPFLKLSQMPAARVAISPPFPVPLIPRSWPLWVALFLGSCGTTIPHKQLRGSCRVGWSRKYATLKFGSFEMWVTGDTCHCPVVLICFVPRCSSWEWYALSQNGKKRWPNSNHFKRPKPVTFKRQKTLQSWSSNGFEFRAQPAHANGYFTTPPSPSQHCYERTRGNHLHVHSDSVRSTTSSL